jgi:tetratricopeptide (TPR) repeat protein
VPDEQGGRVVVERVGAGRYVVGEIVEAGGRLRVTAHLYDSAESPGAAVTAEVEGEPGEFFDLVDGLATDLLLDIVGESETRLTRIAAVTTDSLAALKAYLEGARHARLGENSKAADAFRRAVEVDSAFALAWYGLQWAMSWNYAFLGMEPIYEAADQAARYSDRLPQRERRLLEAGRAALRGAPDTKERLLRDLLLEYPDYIEAWLELGLVLQNNSHLRGRPFAEARQPFERVLGYDPESSHHFNFSLVYLLLDAAHAEDWARVDSLLSKMYPDGEVPLTWSAMRAYGSGERADRERVMALAEQRSARYVHFTAGGVAEFSGNLPGALEFFRLQVRRAEAPEMRALGRLESARIELALGRWLAARSELAELESLNPTLGIEYRALLSTLPYVTVPRAELEALRDALGQFDADTVQPVVFEYFDTQVHNGVHPHLRVYLLGRLSTQLGEHEAALGYADELERMEAPRSAGALARDLAQGIRSRVLRDSGRAAQALSVLEEYPWGTPYMTTIASSFSSQPHHRFARAELLDEMGRSEEALVWLEGFGHRLPDLIFLAPSHLKRAEIYERLGERENAALHYKRFIQLWQDCDPELRPMVEAAERALERLTRESGTD